MFLLAIKSLKNVNHDFAKNRRRDAPHLRTNPPGGYLFMHLWVQRHLKHFNFFVYASDSNFRSPIFISFRISKDFNNSKKLEWPNFSDLSRMAPEVRHGIWRLSAVAAALWSLPPGFSGANSMRNDGENPRGVENICFFWRNEWNGLKKCRDFKSSSDFPLGCRVWDPFPLKWTSVYGWGFPDGFCVTTNSVGTTSRFW